ncbi:MAG: hypothetical protein AAGD10_00080 [Myxococcota bacterium]
MHGGSPPTAGAHCAHDFYVVLARSIGSQRFGAADLELALDEPAPNDEVNRRALRLKGLNGSWMCGWVEPGRRRCELESFWALSERRVPLSFEDYEGILDQIEALCVKWNIETRTRLASTAARVAPRSLLGPRLLGLGLGLGMARWLLGP